jgi:hypothetical protein
METYLIKSYFKNSELWSGDQGKKILTITRPKWYERTMAFDWQGSKFVIESRNFTGLKNVLLQNGKERGELEMEWKSSCTLRLEDRTGMTKYFTFKKKSAFGRSYLLADFQLQPILEISPKWNWKSFRLEYAVDVFDLVDTEAKELDLMPVIGCVYWCTRQLLRSKNN